MALPTVNDIIEIASNEEISVSNMLRKSLVLANSLNVKKFEDWIRLELNGYAPSNEIPHYRITRIELKGKNPYYGWVPVVIGGEIGKELSKTKLLQPISAYENLINNNEKNSSGNFIMPLSSDEMYSLMKALKIDTEITRFVGVTSLVTVIDSVKTIILDWGLKLKDNGIPESKSSFSMEEKREATNVVQNIMIQNFQGVLGNTNNSNLNIDSEIS